MPSKQKVLILGGGITGLSAAYFLKKQDPFCQITLFEKQNRLGGFVQTDHINGHLFEKGPRTFRLGHSPHLLQLIQELNLPIIYSDKSAKKRYLFYKGKLRSMGYFLPMLIPHFFREPFVAKSTKDESIYDFASRRFSPKIANTLFDPITLGIYAGDIRKLSIRSCFPILHQWEQEKGSVLLGMFSAEKKPSGLFTIATGMQSLIDALEKKLDIDLHLNTTATQISPTEVIANGKHFHADKVINALPPKCFKESIWVVNLLFKGDILPKKGFGYLVPSQEKEPILGVIFDSCIFPKNTPDTILTIMVRPQESEPLEAALSALSRHLGVSETPIYSSYYLAQESIPQYLTNEIAPHGVSLEAAVERAATLLK